MSHPFGQCSVGKWEVGGREWEVRGGNEYPLPIFHSLLPDSLSSFMIQSSLWNRAFPSLLTNGVGSDIIS